MNQQEMDRANEELARRRFLWRETELPKIRARMLAAGYVTSEAIKDEIVSVAELVADPHEVWQHDAWSYRGGWGRVEIEG